MIFVRILKSYMASYLNKIYFSNLNLVDDAISHIHKSFLCM